jgi:bifunctional UDP-N-acetylglucosamine pyrophosphorylase / glucosamine-1-phosphate N-acetyltransferase
MSASTGAQGPAAAGDSSGADARVAAVVLAAGRGTRMKTTMPKVLHEVAGVPLLGHVVTAVSAASPARCVVVVGYGADQVRARFADAGVEFVHQEVLSGTGEALRVAGAALGPWTGTVLVVNGDDALLDAATVTRVLDAQRAGGPGMTLLTYRVDDPTGLGRIVRRADGGVARIVEERDADARTRAIREVNPGCYAFDARVWTLLAGLGTHNAAGERYLTDVVAAYLAAGVPVRAVEGEHDGTTPIGVNDRAQLARAERAVRDRIRRVWLAAGVTMHDPTTTYVDAGVTLAPDVVLEPGVVLRGATRVDEAAHVGAYAVLEDCHVTGGAHVTPHTVARGARFAAPAVGITP